MNDSNPARGTPTEPNGEPVGLDDESQFYQERAKNFVELHEQVETSVNLLDSLESFLATFQKDLSAVSGQISGLRARSKDFDTRLTGRRKIEKPLSSLIDEFCIPPALATTILDTPVGEAWLPAIADFEYRLGSLKSKSRVKAARDLGEITEGLRIMAATKIRSFFLALIQPVRTSITTNLQVLQMSILLKYQPLFAFLQRTSPNVSHEIQRTYIGAACLYYETGFRRYTRSLGWVKARTPEQSELIGTPSPSVAEYDAERLSYACLDGPGVTLAYMADDKAYKQPVESLFRAMMMVLMDNSCSEYSFISRFFKDESEATPPSRPQSAPLSVATSIDERQTDTDSDQAMSARRSPAGERPNDSKRKAELATYAAMWKQIMDPAVQYCQGCFKLLIEPAPPVVPFLTMIRLNENILKEIQLRECPPLEDFILGLRFSMWPIFQKLMGAHADAIKKLAEGTTGGLLSKGNTIKDAVIQMIATQYAAMFTSFVVLSDESEEGMLFSNLGRIRQELHRLIVAQATKIKNPAQSAAYVSATCETLLHLLSAGITTHPKAQVEISYWREREEEARRRITSTRR